MPSPPAACLGALCLALCACGAGPAVSSAPSAVPPVYHANGGLTGYLTATANGGAPPTGFQYGISFYSSLSPLNPQTAAGVQLGWGTWIIPDNRTFSQPLCPIGTYARDHWPERGPTYSKVYQTIEGGSGIHVSDMFPLSTPKFRVNGTADCYSHQIASTGWEFGPTLLPPDQLGLAQLSNRLLMVPDGVVMSSASLPGVLGYGWIALPLIPAYTSAEGVPTGDQSWTLFVRAANFAGPVAFYTPAIWSQVNAHDPTGTGRGEDAQPAFNSGAALEIATTPVFTGQDRAGNRYLRIPRITFAANASGQAKLLDDLHYYSKQAIWDAVAAGIQSGTPPSGFDGAGMVTPALGNPGLRLSLGGVPVTAGVSFQPAIVQTGSASGAFGIRWAGDLEPGAIPEYYRRSGPTWLPVAPAQVPGETGLGDVTFPTAQRGSFPPLNTAAASPWSSTGWAAGPFTVTLSDGSRVEYVWYRFADQPAIARLGLDSTVAQRLQTFVEAWQAASGTAGVTIPPPAAGTLVTLDPAQLVTPPAGLETGYVPIVIRQY